MSRGKPYERSELATAVATSRSVAEVLRKLGRVPAGGNYAIVKYAIALHELDTSHFTGQAHNKGKELGPRRPLPDLLRKGSRINSHKLKNRLLRENVFQRKCDRCGGTTWLQSPIPLELHHIDGDRLNNEQVNLRLLCPNCHALTPNYRGKGKSPR